MMLLEDDYEDLKNSLNKINFNVDFIFVPLNNSNSFESLSGEHWSLLIIEKNLNLYLDSTNSFI